MPRIKKDRQPQASIDQKKAEEILRQVQLIVDNSYDAIIGETLNGVITSWNGGAERMFGYSAEEVTGKSAASLLPEEIKNEVVELLDKVKAGKVIVDYDTVRICKDGSRIDVSLSVSPVKIEDGTIIGASVVERDITARKKAEEVLRQIQIIVENSQDGIFGTNLEGNILTWNGGAEKMLGYSAEEIIGKSSGVLFLPEKRAELQVFIAKIRRKEPVLAYDYFGLRKDGKKIGITLSISPIIDEKDSVIGASVVIIDTTERKKMEQELRDSEQKYRTLFETSSDAIMMFGSDKFFDCNNATLKMFSYKTREEFLGKHPGQVSPPTQADGRSSMDVANENMAVALKEGKNEFEWMHRRADGTDFPAEVMLTRMDYRGQVVLQATVRDITERKKSEVRIKELNEIRNKFITIVSHQLRTPLTAVNWNLESILNGDFGKLEDTQYKFLQATHNASTEITHRIQILLTAIDIEEGRVVYEIGEVALGNLCAGIVNEMKKKCEMKNISCAYIPPLKDFPVINGDSEKIRTVITSLMENAIGYTKDGGKVTATLQPRENAARFEITDTGIGIPETEKHFIFTRFFRASNASVMQPDAFGLGLYVAKNFIEQHHGKIGFESKEGVGSTFWFEIPLMK